LTDGDLISTSDCIVHIVEVQGHFESRCRKPWASPTIDRNEKKEQVAYKSKGGLALLGFAFPNLESLTQVFCHCKAGYHCPLALQGF